MKKLLVAVLAMATVSAYAQSHMVRFSNIGGHDGAGDVNFSFNNTETPDKTTGDADKTSSTEIALNYAYTVAPQWQIGLGLDYENSANDTGVLWTVSGYYNLNTDLANATYIGLHYSFNNTDRGTIAGAGEDDKFTRIALEAGKRFAIGSWAGYNLTYAPNVVYSMAKIDFDADVDEYINNDLAWNFLKFDVLF